MTSFLLLSFLFFFLGLFSASTPPPLPLPPAALASVLALLLGCTGMDAGNGGPTLMS